VPPVVQISAQPSLAKLRIADEICSRSSSTMRRTISHSVAR
jgi:hypothetical protein